MKKEEKYIDCVVCDNSFDINEFHVDIPRTGPVCPWCLDDLDINEDTVKEHTNKDGTLKKKYFALKEIYKIQVTLKGIKE